MDAGDVKTPEEFTAGTAKVGGPDFKAPVQNQEYKDLDAKFLGYFTDDSGKMFEIFYEGDGYEAVEACILHGGVLGTTVYRSLIARALDGDQTLPVYCLNQDEQKLFFEIIGISGRITVAKRFLTSCNMIKHAATKSAILKAFGKFVAKKSGGEFLEGGKKLLRLRFLRKGAPDIAWRYVAATYGDALCPTPYVIPTLLNEKAEDVLGDFKRVMGTDEIMIPMWATCLVFGEFILERNCQMFHCSVYGTTWFGDHSEEDQRKVEPIAKQTDATKVVSWAKVKYFEQIAQDAIQLLPIDATTPAPNAPYSFDDLHKYAQAAYAIAHQASGKSCPESMQKWKGFKATDYA